MHKPTASEELIDQLKVLEPQLKKVYVGSILKKSISTNNNKYISLLYEDFSSHAIEVEYLIKDNYKDVVLRRLRGEPSLVHHHWLQFNNLYYIKPLSIVFFWLVIYRMMGGTVVWTLHNKLPHDNPYLRTNRWIRRSFAKLATKLHVHCSSAIYEMSTFLKVPKGKFFVVRHPDYPVKFVSRQEALNGIKEKYSHYLQDDKYVELHEEIYLMLGQIKPYKGIEELVDLFLDNQNVANKKLLVAGRIKDDAYGNRIIQKAKTTKNIIIISEFIPHEDAPLFFSLCTYVIFNHKDVLTSGGVIEALNYKKKIIAPDKGCLSDLEGDNLSKFNTLEELKKMLFA
jgi:beta-1,4-mannosyltransferase